MSSIIRRRSGLMGVSVMRVLPELGLNTQSSGSTPDAVTALLIAPDTRLRAAPYRESGLVQRRILVVCARLREGRQSTLLSRLGRSRGRSGKGVRRGKA